MGLSKQRALTLCLCSNQKIIQQNTLLRGQGQLVHSCLRSELSKKLGLFWRSACRTKGCSQKASAGDFTDMSLKRRAVYINLPRSQTFRS